jgi:hypothetical protein
MAPVLATKHVWLNAQNSTELSERLKQFHSASEKALPAEHTPD